MRCFLRADWKIANFVALQATKFAIWTILPPRQHWLSLLRRMLPVDNVLKTKLPIDDILEIKLPIDNVLMKKLPVDNVLETKLSVYNLFCA